MREALLDDLAKWEAHVRRYDVDGACNPLANTLQQARAALTAPPAEVPEAMKVVTSALLNDPDYAWAWHCNIAMAAHDEGLSHYAANKAAARFLRVLVPGLDTSKHPGFPTGHDAAEMPDAMLPGLLWKDDGVMSVNAELGLSIDQLVKLARAIRPLLTAATPVPLKIAATVPERIAPQNCFDSPEHKASETAYCNGWNDCRQRMLTAAPQAPAASLDAGVVRDAERWRKFVSLDYKVRREWAANLSLTPVLTEWVDALPAIDAAMSAQAGKGGAA